MGKPVSVAIGATVHVPVYWQDNTGLPAQAPSDVKYTAAPEGILALTPDATGVVVGRIKVGAATVTVTGTGLNNVVLTDSVLVGLPLPLASVVHLNP